MKAVNYNVTITGETPLLMHGDNLAWSDSMDAWKKDPASKSKSIAGDDRSPAWRWIGYLYFSGSEASSKVCIPSDNLMTMLREGGKQCPTGKKQGTFKSATQSGLRVWGQPWTLEFKLQESDPWKCASWAQIAPLKEEESFERHLEAVKALGFNLNVKRAKVMTSKHVRVRPCFDHWRASGEMLCTDERLSLEIVQRILTLAGTYCGLGDWRPSAPMGPGPYGQFQAEVT